MISIAELKKELLHAEMSFIEIDNFMVSKEFYSVFDDGIVDEAIEYENVIYTHKVDYEYQVMIEFKMTIVPDEDEEKETGLFIITNVKRF